MERDYKTEFSGIVAEISNFLGKKNIELTEIMTAARKSMDINLKEENEILKLELEKIKQITHFQTIDLKLKKKKVKKNV